MNTHRIIQGDCIAGMRTLPDGCIQTCITSPPYFALRDYSGGKEEIGQEDTVEGYVQKMVEVFREVRRILRDDGTVWLNLGDSYMSAKGCSPPPQTLGKGAADGQPKDFVPPNRKDQKGLKDKDLIGIPWRVAFALQADGWYLRQDIVWSKPNPMPESVTDRCTKSHEYIFLLSKKKHYYFDHEVIREPAALTTHARSLRGVSDTHKNVDGAPGQPPHSMNKPRTNARAFGAKVQEGTKRGDVGNTFVDTGKRNKRSVWTITTKPFRGAHFATYPKDLITPCVLAGTSEHGCCSKCGAPWERQVESTRIARNELPPEDPRYRPNTYKGAYGEINGKGDAGYNSTKTLGWAASCKCKDAEVVPCTVFDPFTGSGTTAVVALQHGRNYIGTELNPQYIKIAESRIADEVPNTLQEFIK
jgi:DNA modification methylase